MRMILGIIGIVLFVICFVSFAFATHYDLKNSSERCGNVSIVGAVSFFLALICLIIGSYIPKPLDEQYNEKIKAFEKASNDLEKFLIEHPEFKTEGY